MRSTEHSPSWGRIRLTVLLATVAAFLLVPAAQAAANGTMTVNLLGEGSGEISSVGGFEGSGLYEGTPPIQCSGPPQTGTCETELVEEEEEPGIESIFLKAAPDPGSEVALWIVEGGFIVGTRCQPQKGVPAEHSFKWEQCFPAVETGEGDIEVTVIFESEEEEEAPEFPLTVTKEGTGEGTVTSTPAGIDCGSECEAEFEEGEEVELSQSAEAGSEFTGWSGACTGTGACEVTMDEAKEVTATFDEEPTPEYELEISTDGTGSGEVECKVDGGSAEACEAEYEEGTEVALVPVADPGSEFIQWSGDCTGSGACVLTMSADREVTATFDEEEVPTPEYNLTIVKAGTGSGSVTCDGGACAPTYEEGEEITLAATATSGSSFAGWSGGGCSGTAGCLVTITADTTVTATFTANPSPPNPTPTPTPTPTPEGKAKAAASASFKGGKAELKLTCSGGPCKGFLKLTAKVKQGGKTKNLVIGKASFSIGEGATATLKVKLSGPAKQELAKGKTLKAKTAGTGLVASTVKIKLAKKAG